jgi:hypothetical protein
MGYKLAQYRARSLSSVRLAIADFPSISKALEQMDTAVVIGQILQTKKGSH